MLYDRLAILENLMSQKVALKRAIARQESQKKKRKIEDIEDSERGLEQKRAKYDVVATGIKDSSIAGERDGECQKDVSKASQTNFWLPSSAPRAEPIAKVLSSRTRCPVRGTPLRAKDLLSVTLLKSKVNGQNDRQKYMCAVCLSILTNSSKPAYLRTSKNVFCRKCIDRFVYKKNIDPLTSQKLDPQTDLISLKLGGTAFAASAGEVKVAEMYQPSIR